MNPAEAVQAHLDLQATASVGMHFGTFQMTTEGIDEPLHALNRAREAHGVSDALFPYDRHSESRCSCADELKPKPTLIDDCALGAHTAYCGVRAPQKWRKTHVASSRDGERRSGSRWIR